MILSAADLFLLLQCATSAACQAGMFIASRAGQPVAVQNKGAGSSIASQVVTEVDQQAQDLILNVLMPACERFDLALLTEETPDDGSRLEKDYFWCVDPMDGTLAFIEGQPGYSVSIALVARKGDAVLGVVYDPVARVLYQSCFPDVLRRQSMPWQLPVHSSAVVLTWVMDRGFDQHPAYCAIRAGLDEYATTAGYTGISVLQRVGAVKNAVSVLELAPACYFKLPKQQQGGGNLWDFAASASLFRVAKSAVVSDIHGQPLALNRAETTYMHQQGVLYASDDHLAQALLRICRQAL